MVTLDAGEEGRDAIVIPMFTEKLSFTVLFILSECTILTRHCWHVFPHIVAGRAWEGDAGEAE